MEQSSNNSGIDYHYRKPTRNIYKYIKMTLQLEKNTKDMSIKRGVRQRKVILQKLVKLALEDIFKA